MAVYSNEDRKHMFPKTGVISTEMSIKIMPVGIKFKLFGVNSALGKKDEMEVRLLSAIDFDTSSQSFILSVECRPNSNLNNSYCVSNSTLHLGKQGKLNPLDLLSPANVYDRYYELVAVAQDSHTGRRAEKPFWVKIKQDSNIPKVFVQKVLDEKSEITLFCRIQWKSEISNVAWVLEDNTNNKQVLKYTGREVTLNKYQLVSQGVVKIYALIDAYNNETDRVQGEGFYEFTNYAPYNSNVKESLDFIVTARSISKFSICS